MHPVDKVLIENWFICSLCLITSCLQGPWSSGIGAQHSQTRPELGVLNAAYLQLNSVSRTEASWLPIHRQALGFPHHLIPVCMPRASSVSTGCSLRLLPLCHSPGTHPSRPTLCTSFLPADGPSHSIHHHLSCAFLGLSSGHPCPSRVVLPPGSTLLPHLFL